jgi:transcriptional regulator with XRE-family HTH domain
MEIERLLREGNVSQRRIARQTGVSRATVRSVASGNRPDYEARRLERRANQREQPLGPIERCRECGGRVYAPCHLCRVRRIKAAELAQRRGVAAANSWPEVDRAPTSPLAGDPPASRPEFAR